VLQVRRVFVPTLLVAATVVIGLLVGRYDAERSDTAVIDCRLRSVRDTESTIATVHWTWWPPGSRCELHHPDGTVQRHDAPMRAGWILIAVAACLSGTLGAVLVMEAERGRP